MDSGRIVGRLRGDSGERGGLELRRDGQAGVRDLLPEDLRNAPDSSSGRAHEAAGDVPAWTQPKLQACPQLP